MKETINCLRCRHAALLPETDMNHASTVIFCGKKNERSPLILSGCGLTDPTPVRKANRNTDGTKTGNISTHVGGDKTRWVSDVEMAFLRHCYETEKRMQYIRARVLRTPDTIRCTARNNGFNRPRRHLAGGCDDRTTYPFTPRQTRFLLAIHGTEQWTRPVNDRWFPENRVRRSRIIARIAELGAPHSWTAICKHLTQQSPAYQRRRQQRKNSEPNAGEFRPGNTPLRWTKEATP